MNRVSKEVLERWLTAWSTSREKPLPEIWKSGYKVYVGDEKQKIRYVFPEVNEDFIQLAESIREPWIYLKVCESFETFSALIPKRWKIQPQGYMMYCPGRMTVRESILPECYSLEIIEHLTDSFIVKIHFENKKEAATGRLIVVDGLAVYDRIITDQHHQRKGLATKIIKELESIAVLRGISDNFLVATEEGKLLYESLGWKIYSLYTSVVIPKEN